MSDNPQLVDQEDADTRVFPLGTVLSITTGLLLSPDHIDGVFDILNFMTGDNNPTSQLPRAADQCTLELLRQHPELGDAVPPDGLRGDAALVWVTEQEVRLGATLVIERLHSAYPVTDTEAHKNEEYIHFFQLVDNLSEYVARKLNDGGIDLHEVAPELMGLMKDRDFNRDLAVLNGFRRGLWMEETESLDESRERVLEKTGDAVMAIIRRVVVDGLRQVNS